VSQTKYTNIADASITTPASGLTSAYISTTGKLPSFKNDAGVITRVPTVLNAASAVAVSANYAVDTYLAGSSITVPLAGDWTALETYYCMFDMVKTGAGTAAFTITLRMGTLGTTGDASIVALAFAVGTAVIDSGVFEVWANFRTVGSGTSAVVAGLTRCTHALAATGLVTTGASGVGQISGTSAGFNSTTQTIIGLSVNGGASFSGTNTIVQAQLVK
jgi:hypothetical protein